MKQRRSKLMHYLILLVWSFVVLFPVWTMLVNSLKRQLDIFRNPFAFPAIPNFSGYLYVLQDSDFLVYCWNTLFVVGLTIFITLFIGSLAAYALAFWQGRAAKFVYLLFLSGIMIPIRLGTINIFQIVRSLGLMGSLYGLIPVYIAWGLPMAIFVLTTFIQELPRELIEVAEIDGASRLGIYYNVILPLIRPALGTVAIINLINIWNDVWFPLIFNLKESHRTLMLGVTYFFGTYQTDWTKVLVVLTLASLPIIILYVLMSKQFIKGLTAGAIKG
ncbi:MAG: carbohydrate ABC transporter permease [Limnochordia bacterium]|nr:carbohydrate ABC transporter permease [Limnochordia bacterium]